MVYVALMTKPDLTNFEHLDPEMAAQLNNVISDLFNGKSIITIGHALAWLTGTWLAHYDPEHRMEIMNAFHGTASRATAKCDKFAKAPPVPTHKGSMKWKN